ncbi:MAG: threonine--tRNA ligase [bacterium]|nr:threonine--tRNA ligase [bacterium]
MVCRPGHEEDPVERIRHSAAHVMASAVQRLFPETKVTIGPVIEEGFFYDFDSTHPFTPEDLTKIEEEMKKIIKENLPFKKKEVTREEALSFFKQRGENYKVEIIEGLPAGEPITLYEHGDWVDLCKGPHVRWTKEIKAFKLLKTAGAYWRGDETRQQLQRIYGTAFGSKEELEGYLEKLKEAESRDHRRLGAELDLFSTMETEGPGLILWHPKGGRVRKVMEDFWRDEHLKNGYELVYTPHIARRELWQTSGHLDFYQENMYGPMQVENSKYQLKPMNCPFHIQIYKSRQRSYRELPLRWAELGTVYRYERSGVLHGLLRVRGFTQDDAHIFCRADQLEDEVALALEFTTHILGTFGFRDYDIYLSTRPKKSVGSDAGWAHAEKSLQNALERRKMKYTVDAGEGVFYGPKIDLKIKDVLGRAWQCSTIQIDFNLPDRFKLDYVSDKGGREQPFMVHRALLGSLERFFGVLVEHYAGAFPTWLAPVQCSLLTITDEQIPYAQEALKKMKAVQIRAEADLRGEKLGAKVREAELQKIPYMLVVGKKEAANGEVSVRSKKEGDLGVMTLEAFIEKIKKEIYERT